MMMQGFYGAYPMSREGSGTSWVPESSPMNFYHLMAGDWMVMLEANATFVFDHQGGPRGDEKSFSENMLMGMASRPLGPGTIGLKTMLTLEPLMGASGYPLLLQTGETADGVTELLDRQHPHDLLMELAGSYNVPVTPNSSVYIYVGYPGEPALGPTTFMHRFSGWMTPEAPITHHWLDSTHITFGVATLGYIYKNWKLEGSSFTGREPDQNRWGFDKAKFDSFSYRLTYNPTENWSFQVSQGRLHSSEQLAPNIDQWRTTASGMYNVPFGNNNWQTTVAWGQDHNMPGNTLNAYLAESAIQFNQQHTIFGRYENVEKDELFLDPDPRSGQEFQVAKASLGYLYDLQMIDHMKIGMGGLGSMYFLPNSLDSTYGDHPLSFMLFARVLLN